MRISKVSLYLVLVVFGLVNIFLLYSLLKLQDELRSQEHQRVALDKKVASMALESRLAGFQFNHLQLKAVTTKRTKSTFGQLRILSFFSSRDCSTCLEEESSRWEELYRMTGIPVYAISVDSNITGAYRYQAKFNPKFPLFHDEKRIFGELGVQRTPVVLLLDQHDKVIIGYVAEVGNHEKQERFYDQVLRITSLVYQHRKQKN